MIYLILFLNLLFTEKTSSLIEKEIVFIVQQALNKLQIEEFYGVKLYEGHIDPTEQNPLAVTRTQGFNGFAFFKIGLNQQISKFTICARKFRRRQTNIAEKTYINIAVIEQFSTDSNCGFVECEHNFGFISFIYGNVATNILNTLPIPKLPPHKFKFNIKIEHTEFGNGTKYFLHLYCAKRENNNFYAETNLDKKEGQIEFLDENCEDEKYKFGVIVTQITANPFTFLIKNEIYMAVKCPNPKLHNNQRDINYDLLINKNGASGAEIKCHEIKETISESKRRRIGADGAGPSEQRELPNEKRMPKITQDLLANFAAKQSDQNQQENEGDRPIIETLNLLDNFGSEDQQKAPAE